MEGTRQRVLQIRNHRQYLKKVDEVKALQKKCVSGIAHQRYRMRSIGEMMKRADKVTSRPEDKEKIQVLHSDLAERKETFREMEEYLPHKNGLYLRIILGQVNVSLLSKLDRFAYKQDYEHFKLVMTIITTIMSFCLLTFVKYRMIDAAFHFLLVWYYCTMTIRESILIVNGSRIKGWWLSHHFVSTVCAGILLIWPDCVTYHLFRKQFMCFSLFISFVQVLQCNYQKGCLYRLRTMGERHNMDITVDGFQSWMWKGLTFLLPFLFAVYIFQFYNAYTLYLLSYHSDCKEWQVPVLAFIFLILFCGNFFTTLGVVRQKLKKDGLNHLRNKYRFNHVKPE
ncbi:ion channel TACAN-like isoform X2 [Lineus longissimus]|uniref:ion channel TACAN-like isoform X2 n=1 Tax=Lineus longissimus TaxID=88925 RepID=UPI00315CB054